MPHACIGVDVIVGFPGETDVHFQETFDFLHSLDVSYFHVFTYSERNNTSAIQLPGAVPVQIRRERNEILRQLSEKKKHHFYHSHLDTTRSVLVEHDGDENHWAGFTDNYIRVNVNKSDVKPNEIKEVRLNEFDRKGEIKGLVE
jgi:threonylcarbamoyladenosine tRNA methylthiotransferase MtaB